MIRYCHRETAPWIRVRNPSSTGRENHWASSSFSLEFIRISRSRNLT
jgi:hypothetical protein